jgi:serine/threonine-protein kinase RsbW
MRFTVKNDPEQIPDVLARIEAWLEGRSVAMDTVMTASLCLEEVLTNTLSYAFADALSHEVAVEVSVGADALTLEISDDGVPFDPMHDAPAPDIESPVETRRIGGLGLHLVKNLMDDVAYRRVDERNRLRLTKRLDTDAAPAE